MPRRRARRPRAWTKSIPNWLAMYEKLGIPLKERAILAGVVSDDQLQPPTGRNIAVDAVFDSVSVATTFRDQLAKVGVIFCPISEAIREHPELVQKYIGSVIPAGDNYFSALNAAVFTDGSFVYIPKGVRWPRWNCRRISASMPATPGSSSGR